MPGEPIGFEDRGVTGSTLKVNSVVRKGVDNRGIATYCVLGEYTLGEENPSDEDYSPVAFGSNPRFMVTFQNGQTLSGNTDIGTNYPDPNQTYAFEHCAGVEEAFWEKGEVVVTPVINATALGQSWKVPVEG